MFCARRLTTAFAAILLVTASVTGCGDDTSSSNNANNARHNDPVDPPDNGTLTHVAPECEPTKSNCLIELSVHTEREIQIQFRDADGQPIENAQVGLSGNFGGVQLSNGSTMTVSTFGAITDSNGVAKATVNAGDETGAGEIIASVDNDSVEPIRFTIGVGTKGSASYRVSFEHDGAAQIKPISVRLFKPSVSCDDLSANPSQTAVIEQSGTVDAAGGLPTVVFPNRSNGDKYTVAAWADSLNDPNVEAAYGCTDGNPPVTNGEPVDVLVRLDDHIPAIAGEYDVTHTFDLRGALPAKVRTVVDLIGRLATDPGSFIIGCPDGGTQDCPAGTDGLAQILVDFLPDGNSLKDTIQSFLDSGVGNDILRNAINTVADQWIQNNAPPILRDSINITSDIYKTLKEFRVDGTIRILDSPQITTDADGTVVGTLGEGSGEQHWNNFTFYWRRGCEDDPNPDQCAKRTFGSRQLALNGNDAPVQGSFSGKVIGSDKLKINRHSLSLNYGALMVAIVEKVVLPEVFGDTCGPNDNAACDSLERALKEMIDCGKLADKVSSANGVVNSLCNDLLDVAGAKLRDYASQKLVANGGDAFTIATPDDQNCTLSQPETYPDDWETKPLPYIQFMGRQEPADMQCHWDVNVQFSDKSVGMDGKFWGQRPEAP